MAPRFPIGTSDFAQLRRDGCHYVDKTGLAVELIRSSSRVVLLPRPRRFGKTLNLSMLRCWLERTEDDRRPLFAGLAVEAAGEDVAAHFQRHPVVFLTFKDTKYPDWESCRADVVSLLGREVERHRPIWSSAAIDPGDRHTLEALATGRVTDIELHAALQVLTRAIHIGSGEEAVLLIDEYDTPIHAGWASDYYDTVITLFRNLLSGGVKDNAHLYRGVLTGVLRVAKESIFSGLNNVAVHSLLSRPFARWFGFTEAEVLELCAIVGPSADVDGIRRWYNGYEMGGHVVYNPWSVLRYLSTIEDGFLPYWVNTASDDLLRRLLIGGGLGLQEELAELIRGGEITRPISENIQLRELDRNTTEVWSFLLFCGYLKARDVRLIDDQLVAVLSIPNREVVVSYRGIVRRWLDLGLGGASEVEALGRSILSGDRARVQRGGAR